MKTQKWLTICLVMAMIAVAIVACGPQDTPEPTATPTEVPDEEPTPTEEPEATPTEEPEPTPTEEVDPVELAIELAEKATRGEEADYEGGSGYLIGVIMPRLDNPGFRAMYIGLLARAIELDVSVTTLDAQDSVDTQLAMIDDLITRGVDGIVFVPVDSAALSTGVINANEAGVPIVAMDRSTEGGELAALVESDNVKIGEGGADLMAQAAEDLGVAIEDLKVLELLGDMNTSAAVDRHEGFSTRAEELGIEIVSELPTYWEPDRANAAVLDGFQANPDINAIYMASGCAMYPGVKSALESLDKLHERTNPEHVILISSDGCAAPLDGIRNGYVDGDSAHQMLAIGGEAVEAAFNAAQGEELDERTIRLAPDLITPENVEEPTHWANAIRVE